MIKRVKKRKPKDWERKDKIKIRDSDGWDDKSFDIPITYEEWKRRLTRSTVEYYV